MFHSIQSDKLQVTVRQMGMELSSIKNLQTGVEYLWQGNPEFWGSQAPVLFPIIGSLKDGVTKINGKEYTIPKHGIVRHSTKPMVIEHLANTVTLQLHWDDDTLNQFPFRFIFEVRLTVSGNKLDVSHTIKNLGDIVMPYCLGGHPAFNCPIDADQSYSDHFLQFQYPEHAESFLIDDRGLLTDSSRPMLENSEVIRLHSGLFNDDALIFKNLESNHVTLKSDLTGDILRVDFHEFPYLGIWAKPGAPFVCIEPWHGITDHQYTDGKFNSKEKVRLIQPGNEESLSYQITILE